MHRGSLSQCKSCVLFVLLNRKITVCFFCRVDALVYMLKIRLYIIDVINDENVQFLLKIATDLSDEKLRLSLLQEATKQWFSLRGFSVTSQLLEQYKKTTKTNIKGTKRNYIR